jgi:hypothetical protein
VILSSAIGLWGDGLTVSGWSPLCISVFILYQWYKMTSGVVELDFIFSSIFFGHPTGLFTIATSSDSFGCILGLPRGYCCGSPLGVAFLSFKSIVPPGTSL